MVSQVSFGALPPALQNAPLAGRNARQINRLIKEAIFESGADMSYLPTPSTIYNNNKRLFTGKNGILSESGAQVLADIYGCAPTCKALCEALTKIFKENLHQ